MRILMWDVHGGYTDALTRGPHEFWFLRDDAVGPDGPTSPGLARLGYRDAGAPAGEPSDGPPSARTGGRLREVSLEELRDTPPDVVLAQRTSEVAAAGRLLGRRPGRDVGAVFCEHNTPKGDVPTSRHPLSDQSDWPIVHVTRFNELFWDCGSTPTSVIEHGLPDPGHRFAGDLAHAAFVINEPVRRWRVTGTDLLPRFAPHPIDAYGIDADRLPAALGGGWPGLRFAGNLSQAELDEELARRRVYLHLTRWTSLGLSLIQAMLLGLPVVVLETTEAARAVPSGAGARSTDVDELAAATGRLLADRDSAAACGRIGREHALQRYGLQRFLDDWTACWERVAR